MREAVDFLSPFERYFLKLPFLDRDKTPFGGVDSYSSGLNSKGRRAADLDLPLLSCFFFWLNLRTVNFELKGDESNPFLL